MYHTLNLLTINFSEVNRSFSDLVRNYASYLDTISYTALSTLCQGEFALSGTVHNLPYFIVSKNAETNLLYLQSFSLFEADTHYFTFRNELNSYELCFTIEGEGYLEYEGRNYILKKGYGFFIDCKKTHHYRTSGSKWTHSVLHFQGQLATNLFEQFVTKGNVTFTISDCPNFEMYQYEILRVSQKTSHYQEYKISCLLTLLLTDLLTDSSNDMPEINRVHPTIINEITDYLKNHYTENILITELSQQFGISRSHLTREFKRYTGATPKDYLTQIRIDQAKVLLRASNMNISEISLTVGFQDDAHFVQIFKSKEYITPLKFRKNIGIII